MIERELGRLVPKDRSHIQKYNLRAASLPSRPVPVVLGINWYQAFDRPTFDSKTRRYWIGKDGNLGRVRGGHAVCLKPPYLVDPLTWWDFYDQGSEGACVGFASSRAMSLLNRKRYDARWLYKQAQLIDDWDETPPEEGTSVRAAMDILRKVGHIPSNLRNPQPISTEGIAENRWATTTEEVVECLGNKTYLDRYEGVPMLNSWGRDYPHIVWISYAVLQRVLDEDGEATMITDR